MTVQNLTTIPSVSEPFIDPRTKDISRSWRLFLQNLFYLTGSGASTATLQDLQISPFTDGSGLENAISALGGEFGVAPDLSWMAQLQAPDDLAPVQQPLSVALSSGFYTPTLYNTTNVTASSSGEAQYLRVGNTVTVSGRADITPTALSTFTELGIELPIPSSFANSRNCAGSAMNPAIYGYGSVDADATNDRALIRFVSTSVDLVSRAYFYNFTYRILP